MVISVRARSARGSPAAAQAPQRPRLLLDEGQDGDARAPGENHGRQPLDLAQLLDARGRQSGDGAGLERETLPPGDLVSAGQVEHSQRVLAAVRRAEAPEQRVPAALHPPRLRGLGEAETCQGLSRVYLRLDVDDVYLSLRRPQ